MSTYSDGLDTAPYPCSGMFHPLFPNTEEYSIETSRRQSAFLLSRSMVGCNSYLGHPFPKLTTRTLITLFFFFGIWYSIMKVTLKFFKGAWVEFLMLRGVRTAKYFL
jgi:hypothetical protein